MNMPRMAMVKVRCGSCAWEGKAPKGCIWPMACPQCGCDGAPERWLKSEGVGRYKVKETQLRPGMVQCTHCGVISRDEAMACEEGDCAITNWGEAQA